MDKCSFCHYKGHWKYARGAILHIQLLHHLLGHRNSLLVPL